VVTLSVVIDRQQVSAGSPTRVHRSIRANRPSTLGRYARTAYATPSTTRWTASREPSGPSAGTRSWAPESTNTSDSSASAYRGFPWSVRRVTVGRSIRQPNRRRRCHDRCHRPARAGTVVGVERHCRV